MSSPLDLRPAADRMARLVAGVPARALDHPTPCEEYSVGDLLDHIGGSALAFTAAAVKQPLGGAGSGDAANLDAGWQQRIPATLATLADSWSEPDAWTGMTGAGGVELPGEVAGVVALDELVIHGWDLAKATGQAAGYDGPGLEAVLAMVEQFRAGGIEGLFGPPVPVPDDAPLLDRILGVTGRDPRWEPPAQ
ncbi:MAG TPA: TIGR03086 family metal-binding protein [Acidimicrobiales bacterium]